MNANGAAQELPSLGTFEEEDDDFAAILLPRRTSATTPSPTPAPAATPASPAAEPTGRTQAPAVPEETEPAKPKAATRAKAKAPGEKRSSRSKPTAKAPAAVTETPADESAGRGVDKIRSSSIHIPTRQLPQVVEYRDANNLSNGQVLIAAIEKAHPHLNNLIHPAVTGGGLFAARATKGARLNEGPLTPLNVRLYTSDFRVIDDLVASSGAFSRGHLATVCFDYFFNNQ